MTTSQLIKHFLSKTAAKLSVIAIAATMPFAFNIASATATPSNLTVSLAGNGTGTVTGTGINCPGTCSASISVAGRIDCRNAPVGTGTCSRGTVVTLTATPAAGSTFSGWSGGCSGTGTCQVTMDSDQAVTATFAVTPPTIKGKARSKNKLIASTGTRTGAATYKYQWKACNVKGKKCEVIRGATKKVFTLSKKNVGQRLEVVVTATNSVGAVQATSKATAVVKK